MSARKSDPHDLCGGCVYFPANLPPTAYAPEDWAMLQARDCSFDLVPGSAECRISRKTSCAIVKPCLRE